VSSLLSALSDPEHWIAVVISGVIMAVAVHAREEDVSRPVPRSIRRLVAALVGAFVIALLWCAVFEPGAVLAVVFSGVVLGIPFGLHFRDRDGR
jgi:hypothetical protein